jgi:hypothetical protein
MRLRDILRKLLAVTALFALLAASTPALADSLSASAPAACCNTVYCPLHHNQGRGMKRDKGDCNSAGSPVRPDSSMRACDATPQQAMGNASFTLAAPLTIFHETTAQPAPVSLSAFAPFRVSIPSTPPPRMFPN